MLPAYQDAVVLVTGGSTGLGRALACGAAEAGACAVIINYAHSAAEAEHTAAVVRGFGAQALLAQGDVGQDVDCRAIAALAAQFGRIDTLFNNAGINRAGDVDDFTAEDFLDVYRVNVVGAFQMARAARSLLEASDRAAIINTSSLAGVTGRGSSLAYTASKGALNTPGTAMAIAFAPKVRVNTICPGFIDTEWFEKYDMPGGVDNMREGIRQSALLKTVSGPSDVADAALFLGSRAARHVTGETLTIDAGLRLGPSR